MPGLVTMSSNGGSNGPVNGTFETERTIAGANSFIDQKSAMEDRIDLGGPVNGAGVLTNGQTEKSLPENSISKPLPGLMTSKLLSSLDDSPPKIKHITEGYSSLGKLAFRVAQHCWLDLTELVDKLGASSGHGDGPMMNGLSNGLAAPGDNNVEKKLLWLNWANSTREKLIKLMVIAKWSEKVNEITQMIDLMDWVNERDVAFSATGEALAQLKLDLHPFKMPNPDIKTALEILSTGKASWIPIPDDRSLPLKKLTPQTMLRVLKDMDSLLSFRLTLHEEIPLHLRDWTIANGRATFSFPQEFEFDITLASDEPSEQLYFVDLRFLYSPAPRLAEGRARAAIRYKADELLKSSGISGCADFLRNFVLTQQISTLRSQAQELRRAVWASSLRIDTMHRWLTVEYWANSSFPKSWIEIGIHNNATKKRPLPGHTSLSSLQAKWKQYGVETPTPDFNLLLPEVSMERILKRFIAAHSIAILRATKEKLQESAGDSMSVSLDLSESEKEPVDCMLKIRLGKFSQQIIFSIEEYSGKLTISPVTDISMRAERDLNSSKNPKLDAPSRLETHIFDEFLRSIEVHSQRCGWAMARKLRFTPEQIAEKFGNKCRHLFFLPPGWKESSWMIAVTVTMQGEKWWAVEIKQPANSTESPAITTVLSLDSYSGASSRHAIDANLLRRIDHDATREIADTVNIEEFRNQGLSHRIEWKSLPISSQVNATNPGHPIKAKTIFVQFSSLLPSEKRDLIADTISIFYKGFDPIRSVVRVAAVGVLLVPDSIGDILSLFSDSSVVFRPPKAFVLSLETPLGHSVENELRRCLLQIIRLAGLIRILKKQKITPTSISLNSISFTYHTQEESSSKEPPLTCTITLSASANARNSISLGPSGSNPHSRVEPYLETLLQIDPPLFFKMLTETLPVMRGLRIIEDLGAASVRTRGVDHFRVAYTDALATFDLNIRRRRQSPYWVLSELPPPGANLNPRDREQLLSRRPVGYQDAVRAFFSENKPDVRGMGTAAVCPIGSGVIEERIVALDATIRGLLKTLPNVSTTDASKAATSANRIQNGPPGNQPHRNMPNNFQRNQRGGAHVSSGRPPTSNSFVVIDD